METRGRKRLLGKFALHLDCPWRIRNGSGKIELGSGDMYTPPSAKSQDETFDWDTFDWDIQGNNLFDEKVKLLFPPDTNIRVVFAALSENNDLTITFSNGLILECFLSISSGEECWRLFKPASEDGHFVVTGTGVERES